MIDHLLVSPGSLLLSPLPPLCPSLLRSLILAGLWNRLLEAGFYHGMHKNCSNYYSDHWPVYHPPSCYCLAHSLLFILPKIIIHVHVARQSILYASRYAIFDTKKIREPAEQPWWVWLTIALASAFFFLSLGLAIYLFRVLRRERRALSTRHEKATSAGERKYLLVSRDLPAPSV
jgi:hypothetical protein